MSETSTASIATDGRVDPQPNWFICQLSDGLHELRLMAVGGGAPVHLTRRREVALDGPSQVVPVVWLSAAAADIKLAELDDTDPETQRFPGPACGDRAA